MFASWVGIIVCQYSLSPSPPPPPLFFFRAQFDPEGFGEIPWADFLRALESPEFCQAVGPAKREILTAKAHRSRTSAITYDDFVAVVSAETTPLSCFPSGHVCV
ncbi:hypothetical protein HPB48_018309 [Haemaphysalis longicornis]|uniref:EF-hand domain-containing protein n=1 Tax=Haemaphysalis longicornis TaxID=44386 RepID=A0A9J6FSP8_HAELO|nr:hypothetical protein HPB48_018309 [Haemaphysalis longicornis]